MFYYFLLVVNIASAIFHTCEIVHMRNITLAIYRICDLRRMKYKINVITNFSIANRMYDISHLQNIALAICISIETQVRYIAHAILPN